MNKKSKQQTTQTQSQNTSASSNYANTNSYGWTAPPDTTDIQALRDFKFSADPHIGYAFGSAKNQIKNSFNNPMGGVYSPQIRDRVLRSSLSNLAMQEAQAQSEANQQLQGQQFGQRAAVAGMTSPRLIQTGSTGTANSTGTMQGTMTGNTVQTASLLPDLIAGAATGAAATLLVGFLLGLLLIVGGFGVRASGATSRLRPSVLQENAEGQDRSSQSVRVGIHQESKPYQAGSLFSLS